MPAEDRTASIIRAAAKVLAAGAMLLALLWAAPAAQAKLPPDFYGVVNQHQIGERDLLLMERAGVGSLRLHIPWHVIQPHPGRCQARKPVGNCNWRHFDGLIGNLAAAGVETFPFLFNVPKFVHRNSTAPPTGSRAARHAWRGFLRALVKRYGRGGAYWEKQFPLEHPGEGALPIRHWEIWNEPSDAPYWHPRPDPREYGRLVKISGRVIHAVDRRADVVLAGLFGTPREEEGGIRANRFYRRVFAVNNIGETFDDVAVHPYGPDLRRVRAQIRALRREMRRARFGGRQLWVTEVGWASDGAHNTLGTTPRRQSKMLTRTLTMLTEKRRAWKVRGVHWYAWQDFPGDELCGFCTGSGLLSTGGETKPSYRAFRRIAAAP